MCHHIAYITATTVALRTAKRQDLLYMSGVISITPQGLAFLFDKPRHQVEKLQEISDPEQGAALAEDELRIGRDDVGPLLRH
jgi:hypothetical protein